MNNKKLIKLKPKVIVPLIATLFLMAQQFISMPLWLTNQWLAAIIASIVQFWAASASYKKAWQGFINRKANMYTLIVLGTLVAYSYSIFVLIFASTLSQLGLPTYLYFDIGVGILAFILLGNYLEAGAMQRTSEAIEKLMKLQPSNAIILRVIDNKKSWVEVPLEHISLGNIIRVDPGAQVPVDGIITQGGSSIDESMVTGESNPVVKQVNDTVIGGTINLTNSFEMKAEKIGKDTILAKIIDLVEQAQKSKAPIQRVVDIIASFFVPIVIICALIAFLIWFNFGPEPQVPFALFSMISVLIIACPCALGLATPISIIVATGRAAQAGILVKDAASLEKACTLNAIVFDKTGTLTTGKPSIIDFEWINKQGARDQLLLYFRLIKLIEERSKHPISRAMIKYLEKNKIELDDNLIVTDFKNIPGYGIKATINEYVVLIGAHRFLERENISTPEAIVEITSKWARAGKTITFIAINNKLIAYYSAMDTIRETAYQAIEELNNMNINSMLLTGDNIEIAIAVSKELGITTFFARILPEDKAKKIMELQQRYSIGMVGDGINDAPALAVADVGIAMGEGTDIAFETAQMALLHNNLTLIPFVIRLSKATMRNIHQNLIWAFGYNILLIPIAMGILYPFFKVTLHPMLAGAAMALSSLSVVLNALRLKQFKKTNMKGTN
jgi:Cu+-exporting ATPase